MKELIEIKSKDEQLREYQLENKLKIYNNWIDFQSVMLQMPTGTGKTRLFASIVKDIHNLSIQNKKAYKVLILAHRQELIKQISENIGVRYGIAHGKIMSKNWEEDFYPTQVASIQTLIRRIDKWERKSFDFIIIDEAHHALAPTYMKICDTFPQAKILGVTATPYRLGKGNFKILFNELIVSSSINEFINKGYLSDYEYYSIKPNSKIQSLINNINEFDFDGDYAERALSSAFDKDKIRANLLETYLKYAYGKKGIVYTINKKHNEHVCKMFLEAGIVTYAIDSDTNSEDRAKIVRDFKNGKIQILCNVNIFSEGFDCPDVEFIQLARPTKSLSMFLQQVGRGFRIHEDKEKAIFLDNVGLYNRFGLPSANRKWQHHFEGKSEYDEEFKSNETNNKLKFIELEPEFEEGDEDIELVFSTNKISESKQENSSIIKNIIDFDLYLYESLFIDLNDLTKIQDNELDNILFLQELYGETQHELLLSEFEDIIDNAPFFKKISHIKKIEYEGKVGMLDSIEFKVLLEPIYDEIKFLNIFGHLLIVNNSKKGIYNFSLGIIEIEANYDDIIGVNNKPNYFILKSNNKFGLTSSQNKIFIEPIAKQIVTFKNLFNLQKKYFWELFNSNFEQIENDFFRKVSTFSNYDLVEYDNVFAICNGNLILFPFIISQYENIKDQRLIVEHGQDGICVLDKNLNYLIEPNNYNQIELINELFFKVSINSKSGFINLDGKEIIPVKFYHCEMIGNNFFLVYEKKWSAIDINGKLLITLSKKKDVLSFANKHFLKIETITLKSIDNVEYKNVFPNFISNNEIYKDCLKTYDNEIKEIRINKVLRECNISFKYAVELFERANVSNKLKNPNSKISDAEYQFLRVVSK